MAVGAGLFAALTLARVINITETFWLLGEQIRDWSVALGPWSDLPLSGTPSTVGGTSLGPVYYWTLWVIRVILGPLFDNLPHAGAVGLAVIQSAADVALLYALWRHTSSLVLATAVVLLEATASYDMALTATLWNPPLAVALVKLALALFLRTAESPSRWRMGATVSIAWLAVQAHSSALFFFAPLTAWFILREALAREWSRAGQTARLIAEIVLILQIPYLVDRLTSPQHGGPTVALAAVSRVIADPSVAEPGKAYAAIRDSLAVLWASPKPFQGMTALLLVAAVGTCWSSRRRPWVLFVTLGPMAAAIAAFSGWTRPFDHYWFLTLSPSMALMAGEGVHALPGWRTREAGILVFMAVILWLQPGRLYASTFIHKLPEYGALRRGSAEIARRTPEIRDVFTEFELPPSTDRTFLFVCLGGRVTPNAGYHAFIARDGSVTFRSTRE